MSSNFIEVAVARGSGTVLERGRVLGVKMFLSSKSEEDGDSRHCVWKSSLPVGGGTRISWGRSRGLVPIINGVPGRVSGVRPMSSSSSVAGSSRLGRLLLGASEFISTKPPDPLDAPANRSAAAVRERESERHPADQPHASRHRDFSHHDGWAIPPSAGRPRWLQGTAGSLGDTGFAFSSEYTCLVLTIRHAGDKLYIGTYTGTVQVYELGDEQGPLSKPSSTNA